MLYATLLIKHSLIQCQKSLNNSITMNLELIAKPNIQINLNAARTFTIMDMQQLILALIGKHLHQHNVTAHVMLTGGVSSHGILIAQPQTITIPLIISGNFMTLAIMVNLQQRNMTG